MKIIEQWIEENLLSLQDDGGIVPSSKQLQTLVDRLCQEEGFVWDALSISGDGVDLGNILLKAYHTGDCAPVMRHIRSCMNDYAWWLLDQSYDYFQERLAAYGEAYAESESISSMLEEL